MSPDLNLYCEPPEFLPACQRGPFEPLAFFGSVCPEDATPGDARVFPLVGGSRPALRVYASFGTIVWRFFEDQALAALEALADFVGRREMRRRS